MDRPVVEVPLLLWGPQLRGAPAFAPEGTNISFARKIARDTLEIRTYERGVEAETTCGSGSCVVAMLARRRGWVGEEVTLIVSGGEALIVQLPAAPGGELVLTGPAVAVHEGSFGFPPRNLKG
jgi:diaminopimelate epimerase